MTSDDLLMTSLIRWDATGEPGGDGKKGSLFDQLEDLDFDECLAKVKAIAAVN